MIYLLVGLNVLNYADRFIISAVAPSIQNDLGFTDSQLGLIGTAFLWGFVLATPFVGALLRRFSPQIVLAFAVMAWSGATAATGIVRLLLSMLALRAVIGIGQAVFSTASLPIIEAMAAKSWKNTAITMYNAAMPIGIALGFIAGGYLDLAIGWQMGFVAVGIFGIPVALLLHCCPIKPVFNANRPRYGKSRILSLRYYPNYLITLLGNILQIFAIAGFAFWAPVYFSRSLNYPAAEGSMIFGIIFICTGAVGTLFGGWLINRFAKNQDRQTLMKIIVYLMIPASMGAFIAIAVSQALWFFIAMAVVQFLLFATYTPFSLAFFQTVPKDLKNTAYGVNMFLGRLAGDMFGIWFIGFLSTLIGGLSLAMYILPFTLVLATIIWYISSKTSNLKLKTVN